MYHGRNQQNIHIDIYRKYDVYLHIYSPTQRALYFTLLHMKRKTNKIIILEEFLIHIPVNSIDHMSTQLNTFSITIAEIS